MVASIGKGVMRFVGGQISHTQGATFKTQLRRSGAVVLSRSCSRCLQGLAALAPQLAGARGQLVIGHVGAITLSNSVSSVVVRPGYVTWVPSANEPIPRPIPVPDAL